MIAELSGIAAVAEQSLKACLLLGIAALVTLRLRRHSAVARHAVWLAAFLGIVALPAVGALPAAVELAWLPALVVPEPGQVGEERRATPATGEGRGGMLGEGVEARAGERQATEPRVGRAVPGDTADATDGRLRGAATRADAGARAPSAARGERDAAVAAWLAGVLAITYFTIAAGLLFRLVLGVLGATRLGSRATPVHDAVDRGDRGRTRRISLVASEEVGVPVTFGMRRPTIVVPPQWASWPAPVRRSVMLHETAHVDRYDWPVQLFARAVCAVHWFNPLVWLAARRLFAEAERACDERVLQSGSSAADYAAHLLLLARTQHSTRRPRLVMAMARPSDLRARVETIRRIYHIHQGALPMMSRRTRSMLTFSILAVGILIGGVQLTAAARSITPPAPVAGPVIGIETPAGTPGARPSPAWQRQDRNEALLAASAAGDVERVRSLLEAGADPDTNLAGSGTPLIRAASRGHIDVVETLLRGGADPDLVLANSRGWEAPGEELMRTALTEAARRGHLRVAQRLLDAGATVDAQPSGDATALMEAAENRHEEIVRLLLGVGADVDRVVEGDGTPLIAAARGGDPSILRLLLDAGADVNGSSRGDGNAIITAVRRGDREMVRLLLDAGADPNQYVPGDETALVHAAGRGDEELMLLLLGRQR